MTSVTNGDLHEMEPARRSLGEGGRNLQYTNRLDAISALGPGPDVDTLSLRFHTKSMSKIIGIDLGTTNSVRGRDGGRSAHRHPERGREPNHPLGRRVQQDRRAIGGTSCEAPGRHQSGKHDLLDQAVHGPPLRRSQRRNEDGPVPRRARRQRRRARQGRRPGAGAAAALRDDPAEVEAGRGGLPRPAGHQGRHHRARVFQRRAAPGHQGSRPDCRPRSDAHRQRADRGRARLRSRQEEGRDHRRVRLRRRHVRHLDPRSRRGRRRGEVDQRRHAPRRRQPRSARHRVDHRRVPEERRHRSRQGPHGAAAPARGRREGEDGALHGDGDGDQPAVHHRGCERAEAPGDEADARASSSRSSRTCCRRPSAPPSRRWPTPASTRRRSTRSCWSAARRASRACRRSSRSCSARNRTRA